MKKTSSIIRLACAVITCVLLQSSTIMAAEPTAEEIADGFAAAGVSYWTGEYQFIGNRTNLVRAYFTLQPKHGRWVITQLRINEVELPIDPVYPLTQFPAYSGTVNAFGLNMSGYGLDGQIKRYGYFNASALAADDDIKIRVNLSYVYAKLPYTFSGDHSAVNTVIQSEDGNYSGWYDSSLGVFVVGFDPLRSPKGFNLIDSRNNSIFGWVPFSGRNPAPKSDNGFGFSFEIDGGTLETFFTSTDQSTSFAHLKLDESIVRLGTNHNAKIVLAHTVDINDYLNVYSYGVRSGSWVEAWGLGADGIMRMLDVQAATNDVGLTIIIGNLTGYQDYKIVVVGNALNPISGASVDIYRSDYPWSYDVISAPINDEDNDGPAGNAP